MAVVLLLHFYTSKSTKEIECKMEDFFMKDYNKNNYIAKNSDVQNKFTAYLSISLKRRKVSYLQSKSIQAKREVIFDMFDSLPEMQIFPNILNDLPFIEQIENQKLLNALLSLKKRDLYILLSKVLGELTYAEIAHILEMKYTAVTNAYYRIINKIKEELDGENQ